DLVELLHACNMRFNVQNLSGEHPFIACFHGKQGDETDDLVCGKMSAGGKHLKGIGEQEISCKHGVAFGEGAMEGGFASTKVVVIHAGKVIMDHGVGVDHLKGAGGI